jgi:hypothetical protein
MKHGPIKNAKCMEESHIYITSWVKFTWEGRSLTYLTQFWASHIPAGTTCVCWCILASQSTDYEGIHVTCTAVGQLRVCSCCSLLLNRHRSMLLSDGTPRRCSWLAIALPNLTGDSTVTWCCRMGKLRSYRITVQAESYEGRDM